MSLKNISTLGVLIKTPKHTGIKSVLEKQFKTSALGHFLFNDTSHNSAFSEFPNINCLWLRICSMKAQDECYKEFLLRELMNECGINTSSLPLLGFERNYILRINIDILKKLNIVGGYNDVKDRLLSQLEPFPFDDQDLLKHVTHQNDGFVTIKMIKNLIEKQYLAWKFGVDISMINAIYYRLYSCINHSSSIKSLASAVELLNHFNHIQDIVDQIFLLQIKPLTITDVMNFKNNLLGMRWGSVVHKYPYLMKRSYHYILFMVDILKDKGFTNSQILKGLPFLKLTFLNCIKRVNFLLVDDKLKVHREDDKFLQLLFYTTETISRLVYKEGKMYKDLLNLLMIENYKSVRFNSRDISYILIKNSFFNTNILKTLLKHPKYLMSSETQMEDTINYLQQANFAKEEIMESINIILYPRGLVKKTLNKILQQNKVLSELGFVDGCVSEETNFFTHGTKLRRKTLQLCLYFIEKEFNFTGEGVLSKDPS